MSRAERLEDDVVEATELVAGRRIRLGGQTVPAESLIERRDRREQGPRRREVLGSADDVALSSDQLIRLAQVGRSALADDFMHDRSGEWVAGHPRERVGTATLQGHAKFTRGLQRPRARRRRRQPSAHDPLGRLQR